MNRDAFIERFGGVFEHSPWIAAAVFDAGSPVEVATATELHQAMCAVFRNASQEQQLEVVRAHPDLAGRLAVAGELTAASTGEQASAGLDRCTPDEFSRFQALNDVYQAKFGFPFIMAVKGRTRSEILAAFEARVQHDAVTEFDQALAQIERIALLRLQELLP